MAPRPSHLFTANIDAMLKLIKCEVSGRNPAAAEPERIFNALITGTNDKRCLVGLAAPAIRGSAGRATQL